MYPVTKLAAALAFSVGLAGAAHAQAGSALLPDTGTIETAASANLNFDPVDSQNISARAGYFFNRNLQAGLEGTYSRIENGTSQDAWTLGAFGNWHVPLGSPLLPYVGAFVGLSDSSGGQSSTSVGLQGGAKWFFNQNVAGFGELRWRDVEDSDDSLGLFFGLAVFFR
ncbi:MAG TPA: outer membrane beta-barrel protein [Burkholderiaceae bacterium]|nr:outer membrane beta-barrel protein [Burkholderiaceae bacterium]